MRVRLTPKATRELSDIADYLDAENPSASIRVEQSLKRLRFWRTIPLPDDLKNAASDVSAWRLTPI